MVRLVKGAYWDSEIKRAQERGLDWLSGVHPQGRDRRLLPRLRQAPAGRRRRLLSAIRDAQRAYRGGGAGDGRRRARDWEFQRLHGMGEALYDEIVGPDKLDRPCRVYAPVGSHEDLLAYLVRRLLENGANTSFVNRIVDEKRADRRDRRRPDRAAGAAGDEAASAASRCRADLYRPERRNSQGLDLADPRTLADLRDGIAAAARRQSGDIARAGPIVGGVELRGAAEPVFDPSDRRRRIGSVADGAAGAGRTGACSRATRAAPTWDATPADSARRDAGPGRRPVRAAPRRIDGADHPRRRPDHSGGAVGSARGRRFPALLRGPRPRRFRHAGTAARPDRRAQPAGAARPRRLRLHLAVEFPAGDLHRPDRRCARRRQRGHRQAGRADAARRRGGGAPAAGGRHPGRCAAPAARAGRERRRGPGRRPAGRRHRLHRLDRDGAGDQPRAGQARRADRAVDRRDRRPERDDRRFVGACPSRSSAMC